MNSHTIHYYEIAKSISPNNAGCTRFFGRRFFRNINLETGEFGKPKLKSGRFFDTESEARAWGRVWEDLTLHPGVFPIYYGFYTLDKNDKKVSKVVVKHRPESPLVKLTHRVIHSPTGMSWGYKGSGPSDLAASIMANYLGLRGSDPSSTLYHDFAHDFVSQFNQDGWWSITSDVIEEWIKGWRQRNPNTPTSVKRNGPPKRVARKEAVSGFGIDL